MAAKNQQKKHRKNLENDEGLEREMRGERHKRRVPLVEQPAERDHRHGQVEELAPHRQSQMRPVVMRLRLRLMMRLRGGRIVVIVIIIRRRRAFIFVIVAILYMYIVYVATVCE